MYFSKIITSFNGVRKHHNANSEYPSTDLQRRSNLMWLRGLLMAEASTLQPHSQSGAVTELSSDDSLCVCVSFVFSPPSPSWHTPHPPHVDHIALIIELLGSVPRKLIMAGKYSKDFFTKKGKKKSSVENYSRFFFCFAPEAAALSGSSPSLIPFLIGFNTDVRRDTKVAFEKDVGKAYKDWALLHLCGAESDWKDDF